MSSRIHRHLADSHRRHLLTGTDVSTSIHRHRARGSGAPQLASRRCQRPQLRTNKLCYEKQWNLAKFVTWSNFELTEGGTALSSAVVHLYRALTATAELRRLVINEIRSSAAGLKNHPSMMTSSRRPTALSSSIFGETVHLKLADATHIKHIYVRARARPRLALRFENSMKSVTTGYVFCENAGT
jgi:hypothetical protein